MGDVEFEFRTALRLISIDVGTFVNGLLVLATGYAAYSKCSTVQKSSPNHILHTDRGAARSRVFDGGLSMRFGEMDSGATVVPESFVPLSSYRYHECFA